MGKIQAPQFPDLGCYPVEKKHMYNLPAEERTTAVVRFIDNIFKPATMPLPTPHDYGMEYKSTVIGETVTCLGIMLYMKDTAEGKGLHTTVHDREADYPPPHRPLPMRRHHSPSLEASSWGGSSSPSRHAATWMTSSGPSPPSSATRCGAATDDSLCGVASCSSAGQP